MWCPRALADASNRVDVVDAAEFGDGGLERLDLPVPVCHIYRADPCHFARFVELIGEGLGAFGVSVGDEDLGSVTVGLVWGLTQTGQRRTLVRQASWQRHGRCRLLRLYWMDAQLDCQLGCIDYALPVMYANLPDSDMVERFGTMLAR